MAERVDIPAWLDAAVDQRLAWAKVRIAQIPAPMLKAAVIETPLKEPPPGTDVARWDRTCDNCGRFVPPSDGEGELFYTGSMVRDVSGVPVVICFGTCKDCKDVG